MPLTTHCMATRKELLPRLLPALLLPAAVLFLRQRPAVGATARRGAMPVAARWRRSKITRAIHKRFGRKVRIIVRADSGFAREEIMAWCEANAVLAAWDWRAISGWAPAWARASENFKEIKPERSRCLAAALRTLSIARARAGAARAGWWAKRRSTEGENPRFVVTNLPAEGFSRRARERFAARPLLREATVARRNGKPHRGGTAGPLADGPARAGWPPTNSGSGSRLSPISCSQCCGRGIRGTDLASATLGQIQLKLFKIGAHIKINCHIHLWS